MLYQTVAFALLFFGLWVQAHKDEEMEKGLKACEELFSPEFRNSKICCEAVASVSKTKSDHDPKMCPPPGPGEAWKCEHSECLLKIHKLLLDNGEIDYEEANKHLDEFAKMSPPAKEMIEKVKNACSKDKLKNILGNDCIPLNYQTCMMADAILACPNRNEDEQCSKIYEKAKLCNSAYMKMEK